LVEPPADGQLFVNSAGLHAPALAQRIYGLDPASIPPAYFAKGHYFRLDTGKVPFSRLVYPVPVPGGLGIHLTLDLSGRAKFGPDVEWVERVDYRTGASRAPLFEAAVRRYWPTLPTRSLVPDYTGIRPKIVPPGSDQQDFIIQGPAAHGTSGLINLYGIESPGLTASLAIADEVVRLVSQ
jgi:L-2-hydroxyglutarate oxidase LhgO